MSKRQRTIGTVLIERLGFRRATVVAAYISLWSMYRATEGGDPASVSELADALQRDRATVYRWQADFAECFPQWSDPGRLLDAANVARVVNARQTMQLRVA